VIGQILKEKRKELGLDLEGVSRTTKIRYEYLKAIEDDAFEKLPVEVYVKGYIKEYCKILCIDPQPIIDAYIQQITPPEKTEKKEIPQKEGIQKRPKAQYILFALLLLLICASIFFVLSIFAPEKQKPPPPPETKSVTHHTLEVIAKDTTWLFVIIDGAKAKEILLNPGEYVKWKARYGFYLKIGNAGEIKLFFDGRDIGPVGKKGEVITITLPPLNPENKSFLGLSSSLSSLSL
jgi:cytoskeleton protein RodZ